MAAWLKRPFPFPVLVLSATALVCLLFLAGLIRPSIMVEDGPVENASAALFLYASLLGFWTLATRALASKLDFKLILGISLFSLLLFLSEVSFGARLFDFEMPPMEGGGEFDGGHDIAIILLRMMQKGDVTSLIVALSLLFAFICFLTAVYKARHPIERFLQHRFNFTLVLHIILLAIGVLLDLVPSRKVSLLEEAVEFTAAIVLVWALLVFRRV
ncbi:hypothetical protein [Roseobacter weihaiensis]|uniref:hypothetical protein n=1 Tax=Roseobacter weihaiensis TaxID=2763262 RepID=UPI001D0BD4F0|nr:hypothetical protein [Roseobacter sp. H9]